MTQQEALVVLNAIPGLTGSMIRKLMTIYGSACDLLSQTEEGLIGQGLNPALIANILHFPKEKFLEEEYRACAQLGVVILTPEDQSYPFLLKDIPQAPIALYVQGQKEVLNQTCIALVGSRKASAYGLKMAEEFGRFLGQSGLVTVSGGAYGIDTKAHQACMQAGGISIAVLGSGLAHLYPKENMGLFRELTQKGAVISEFPLSTPPVPYNFPRRNRIISGLSLATVVIEAAEQSGSLITADYATEQDRAVFALPGNADNPACRGTNRLIQEGARMVLSPYEVLEELGIELQNRLKQEKDSDTLIDLSEDEYKIYQLINHTPQHIDIISSNCEACGIGALMAQVLSLELKGAVKQLPGQYYVRL